jgi:hypothetical protein
MSARTVALFTAICTLAFAVTLGGCPFNLGNVGSGDPNTGTDPNTNSGTDNIIDVHLFRYNTDTKEYILGSRTISEAQVRRDLAGELCGQCHAEQVDELKDSVHYRWASRNDNVLFPGGGAHGMIDRACGLPSSTSLINYVSDVNMDECGKCHPGRYMPMMEGMFAGMFSEMGLPNAADQAARIVEGGLDCLICHAEQYRSYPEDGQYQLAKFAPEDAISPTSEGYARVARDDTDFDGDGQPDPLIDTNGDGVADMPLMMDRDGDGVPETPWPTVAQDRSFAAISTVGLTTDEHCLRCHEHARTGYKRGTLFRPGHDIHSDSEILAEMGGGEGRHCVACHEADHHKFVRGDHVGGDLMASDYEVGSEENNLECTKCHNVAELPQPAHLARHIEVMACETCHIPYASGITYALYGHGGQLNFGRNEDGLDTKLITADHLLDDHNDEDVNTDWQAYRVRPSLVWFDGRVSFLAQSLAVRGVPNAKITPFKPMANGMIFDARYFNGEMMAANPNDPNSPMYNAHAMYRFMTGNANADIFAALDFLDLTPDEARSISLMDFFSDNPDRQAMALMQIFPNLVYFDKNTFDLVRYTVGSQSAWDANDDGFIDVGAPFNIDMLAAANNGLRAFQGFNAPMQLPANYEWYPPFEQYSDLLSMKVPDGTLIKMFLGMQGMQLPAEQQEAFFAAIANYPAYSNGITLGGHGVRPKEEALGASFSCTDCHASGGVMDHKIPVTQTVAREIPGMGTLNFPIYRWRYYNIHALTDLGLTTQDEDIVAGTADVDIAGDTNYRRESENTIVVNYLNPAGEGSYRAADHADSLAGTNLTTADLTINGGSWMSVLEPEVNLVPNYQVLGYSQDELFFLE